MKFPRLVIVLASALALAPQLARADCSLTTTGNIPLPDLGTGTYQGFTGGLYPGGTQRSPAGARRCGACGRGAGAAAGPCR